MEFKNLFLGLVAVVVSLIIVGLVSWAGSWAAWALINWLSWPTW